MSTCSPELVQTFYKSLEMLDRVAAANISIFESFLSTDLQHGKGLTMHMVYKLISRRLNAHIVCQSQLNQGVLFEIELPL